jgi:hypothetical protein
VVAMDVPRTPSVPTVMTGSIVAANQVSAVMALHAMILMNVPQTTNVRLMPYVEIPKVATRANVSPAVSAVGMNAKTLMSVFSVMNVMKRPAVPIQSTVTTVFVTTVILVTAVIVKMLMNVQPVIMTVIPTRNVSTPREATTVSVTLDTLAMAYSVMTLMNAPTRT